MLINIKKTLTHMFDLFYCRSYNVFFFKEKNKYINVINVFFDIERKYNCE